MVMRMAKLIIFLSVFMCCCIFYHCEGCPHGCTCTIHIANCSNSELSDLPENLYYKTKIIDLSWNKIDKIRKNLFLKSYLSGLRSLNLSHNEISSISPFAFKYEVRLQHLDLSWNHITMPNVLTVKYNALLEWLSLQGNNELRLTSFGNFLHSDSMKYLDMSYCNLTTIPNNTFLHLIKLQHLNLSHNNINHLEINSFSGIENLSILDLSSNQLTDIQVAILKEIFGESQRNILQLFNNPFIHESVHNITHNDIEFRETSDTNFSLTSGDLEFTPTSASVIDTSSTPEDIHSVVSEERFFENIWFWMILIAALFIPFIVHYAFNKFSPYAAPINPEQSELIYDSNQGQNNISADVEEAQSTVIDVGASPRIGRVRLNSENKNGTHLLTG